MSKISQSSFVYLHCRQLGVKVLIALAPCQLLLELTTFATLDEVILRSIFLIAGKFGNFISVLFTQFSFSVNSLLVPFVQFSFE